MSEAVAPADVHADAHGHAVHHPRLQHHFDTMQQQKEASTLGMWVFLLTEVLFFGGLFCAYAIYRGLHPEIFVYAHYYLDTFWGAVNTCVLIVSSLTAAWAVRNAQLGEQKKLVTNIIVTIALACCFLVVKYVEYSHKFHEHLIPGPHFAFEPQFVRQAQIFFSLYFMMTGLHALHMIVGMGLMIWMLIWAYNGTLGDGYYSPVEIVGLYWHFVDIVWIFLFPLLYLIGRHG